MSNNKILALISTFILSYNVNALVNPLGVSQNTHMKTSLKMNLDEESSSVMMQRRAALGSLFGVAVAVVSVTPVNALDMEAFANRELVNDTKNCDPKKDPKCIPPLTSDEALCKYGQSGEARGEACKRVKEGGKELPSAKPQGKSLGGAYAM